VRIGLTARALLTSTLLTAVMVGGLAVLTASFASLRSVERENSHAQDVLAAAYALEKSVLGLQSGINGYLLTGDNRFLRPYLTGSGSYRGEQQELLKLADDDRTARRLAGSIGAAITRYVVAWAGPVLRLSRTDPAAARGAGMTSHGRERVDAILAKFAGLENHEKSVARAQQHNAGTHGAGIYALGLVLAAASGLLIFLHAVGLQRDVVRPANRLAAAVSRIRRGDLAARVSPGGAAEMGELTSGFNVMAAALEASRNEAERRSAELQVKQADLEHALEVVEEQRAKAEALHGFGGLLAAQLRVQGVAEVALCAIGDTARAQTGALYVLDERNGSFQLEATRGPTDREHAAQLSPGHGPAGRALAEKRPVRATFPESGMRLPGMARDHHSGHELHLPLLHRGRTLGLVSLSRPPDEEFTALDTAALGPFAEHAAVACSEAVELRRAERLAAELQALMDSTDEGIIRTDLTGHITFANRAALTQTGYTAAELLGQGAHEMIHHSRPDGSRYPGEDCPVACAIRDGDGIRLSGEVFWRKDGSRFPVDCSSYPVREGGTVTGAVVTLLDVSGRTMAERQLATEYQVARVLATAESVPDALPRLLLAACRGLGWQMGFAWAPAGPGGELRCAAFHAVPGREMQAALLAGELVPPGRGPAGKALQGGEPVFACGRAETITKADAAPWAPLAGDLAVPVTGRDGVSSVLEFIGHDNAQAAGLLETMATISSQFAQYAEGKRAGEAAARMKNDFVATVSHELRTPLTAIDGWLHIVLGGEPGPLTDEQRKFLTTVKESSERLMRLVGDLLLIGQVDAGMLGLERGAVDMAQLAAETVTLFAPAAAAKQIEVGTDSRAAAVVVHGDRLRLGQLLGNLFSNAIKFTPPGGKIGVVVRRKRDACLVEITDTGIGVPAADREHLFERFYRGSGAASHGISGAGLGLAICKVIADAHEGQIRVEDGDGPGTTFVLELPLSVRREARA
jgi:PAS domain S-box-containing protein